MQINAYFKPKITKIMHKHKISYIIVLQAKNKKINISNRSIVAVNKFRPTGDLGWLVGCQHGTARQHRKVNLCQLWGKEIGSLG